MKISAKLLGPVLVIFVLAFGGLAYLVDRSARSALVLQAGQQLEVVRRSRAQALTTYFQGAYDGMATAAGGVTPQVLLQKLPEAIRRFPVELRAEPSSQRAHLIAFYKTAIDSAVGRSALPWPSAEEYVARLSPEAIALQSEYVATANDAATESHRTTYGALRAEYQPRVVGFGQSFNWHDVMLVATDGTVVYCLRKDIELGANLRTRPFKATPLADAFEHAMRATADDAPFFVDFAPYAPALGAPTGFISVPVFGRPEDVLLGALVLLVPLNAIERTLTERSGFGPTQEAYVVGPDLLMRSSSRFQTESTSLKLRVDTDAVRRALAGETGTIQQLDYRKTPVLASFAPLPLAGTTWALVAEIDLSDVLSPARALRLRIVWMFLLLTAVAAALLIGVLRRLDTTQARLAESRIDLRQVSARLNDAREQERGRLARDVHDQIGQALTAFKMDVAEVRRRLSRSDYGGADARLIEMSTLIDASLVDTRRLASELHPPALEGVGPIEAMRAYLLDYSRRTDIACHFDAQVASDAPPLATDRATALFRILQEALTNVARHADAHRVDVRLIITGADASLVVSDDGRGVPPLERRPDGLGLAGMRDRALLFGGDVSIAGAPLAGTTVTARLPLAGHP